MKDRKNITRGMLLLLFTTFLISFVSAAGPLITINITNQTINVQGFLFYETYGKYPAPIITDFNETLPINISCINITTTNNSTNVTTTSPICSAYASYSKDVPITFSNQSLVVTDTTSQVNYNTCLTQKAQFETGLNSCAAALNAQVMYKDNFTQCSTDLQICNSDKARTNTDLTTANKTITDNQNAKWYWGIGGIILGVGGYMLLVTRQIGGPKPKTREDDFNKSQAG